jgi:hypothetical protein
MRTTIIRSTKNPKAETKRQRIHLAAAFYSYNSTLDDEGDEIDLDQLSDEEFESYTDKLKVKERERIAHWRLPDSGSVAEENWVVIR